MALQDRVFSMETEYAVSFYGHEGNMLGAAALVDVLSQALTEGYGLSSTVYLVNGSMLVHDVGHAEWALPECRSAHEVAVYDKAADHLFHRIVPRAQRLFEAQDIHGRLVVTKNNADNYGHTYGCHENYQMMRDADLLTHETFVRYMAHVMIPFLVSRQLLVGAGRLITRRGSTGPELSYELSQRAGFIQTVVSRDTTKDRPIFNLGREAESFADGNFRRLHPILGDANLSGWATWIKLGSTGLLLRMVEDVFIERPPALALPLEALRAFAQDITGRARARLQDGRELTAAQLQWEYYNQADAYLTLMGASEDDEALMEEWGRALEDCEQDPMRLRDRADWAIKKQMLDTFLQQMDCSFAHPPSDPDALTDLQALDLRYHEISHDGLYSQVYPVDTLVTEEEIARAQQFPPPYTRANVRGTAIRLGRELGLTVYSNGWMGVTVEEDALELGDPMEFDHPALLRWTHMPWETLHRLRPEDNEALLDWRYKLGLCWRQYGRPQQALAEFQTALGETESRKIARALADQLLRMGRYGEALEMYEQYNTLVRDQRADDEFFQAFALEHVGPGDACRFLGQDERARELYRAALQTRAISALVAMRNLGLLDLKAGYLIEAERAFRDSIAMGERLVSSVGLAVILHAQGQPDEARELFERALSLAARRASGLSEPGLTPAACRYFEAVACLGLSRPDALDTLRSALDCRTAPAADGLYALNPMIQLLAGAPQPPVACEAALALVEGVEVVVDAGDEPTSLDDNADVLRRLGEALNDANPRVRVRAVDYLVWRMEAGHQAAVDALFPILIERARTDPDALVRRAAIHSLAHPAAVRPGVMDELMGWLRDPDPAIRWAAQDSLEQISRPGHPPITFPTEVVARVPRVEDDFYSLG